MWTLPQELACRRCVCRELAQLRAVTAAAIHLHHLPPQMGLLKAHWLTVSRVELLVPAQHLTRLSHAHADGHICLLAEVSMTQSQTKRHVGIQGVQVGIASRLADNSALVLSEILQGAKAVSHAMSLFQ